MTESIHHIEITFKSIVITIGTLLGLYFLFQIRDIIIFIFVGLLVMAAIHPLVCLLESWKLSRGLSIGLVYIVLITLISVAIAAIFPPLITQAAALIAQIPIPPRLAHNLSNINLNLQDIQVIFNQLTSVPKILNTIGSAFSGIVIFVSLVVFSFYLLLERAHLSATLRHFYRLPKQAADMEQLLTKIETQIGDWVRAESILMFAVGLLTFIGLTLLRINFALSLAVIAGILEILPTIGPALSAIPALVIAYVMVSPVTAVMVLVLYIIVQQIEINLIVPHVMHQMIDLSPVITIVLLLIGFQLDGITGAALAIPLFLVIKIIIVELFNHDKRDVG